MASPNLTAFLAEVHDYAAAENMEIMEAFGALMKSKHYWPAIQWKKYPDHSGLILLHNTYKRTDVEAFQALYDECRSVVLDLSAPMGENIIISLANAIPERVNLLDYRNQQEDGDVCTVSYEGTVISVYFYKEKWYFSTSSCPFINRSRYVHPTKRHGTMLDEALAQLFETEAPSDTSSETAEAATETAETPADASVELRSRFTALLNPEKVYFFILVHHENNHIMNYTEEFGEGYAKLVHIMTRDKATQEECVLPDAIFTEPPYANTIKYSRVFASPAEAIEWMTATAPGSGSGASAPNFGIIVKKPNGKLLKVASTEMLYREQEDLGNPNPWLNMLWVYIQNKPHYHVNQYIDKYCPNIMFPVDKFGRTLAPVYMIHTIICTIRDCLYQSYVYTTKYYPQFNRWKMNKELDGALPKIIRFHLSQLRNIQVSTHSGTYLNAHAIYHYLCLHQSMPNLLKLIRYFASGDATFHLTPTTLECFQVFHRLISNTPEAVAVGTTAVSV
jgi:hypothetical protein